MTGHCPSPSPASRGSSLCKLDKNGTSRPLPGNLASARGDGWGGGDWETWSSGGGGVGDTEGKGPGLLWRQAWVWRQLFKETRVEEVALPGGTCDRAAWGRCLLGQAAG